MNRPPTVEECQRDAVENSWTDPDDGLAELIFAIDRKWRRDDTPDKIDSEEFWSQP